MPGGGRCENRLWLFRDERLALRKRAIEVLSSGPQAAENNRHECTGKTAGILLWTRREVVVIHLLFISFSQLRA